MNETLAFGRKDCERLWKVAKDTASTLHTFERLTYVTNRSHENHSVTATNITHFNIPLLIPYSDGQSETD